MMYIVIAVIVGLLAAGAVYGFLKSHFRSGSRFEDTLDVCVSIFAGVVFGFIWPITLFICLFVCAMYSVIYILDRVL